LGPASCRELWRGDAVGDDARPTGELDEAVSDGLGLEIEAEVSIEANPEDWTLSYAESLREIGFIRVSLGVQSFDHDTLAALGRNHTPADGAKAVAVAQTAGFDTVNADLILGTPGESIGSWSATVRIAIDLEIDHLSAYALTVERGTALSRQVKAGASAPDPDDQADKYLVLVEAAAKAVRHYEMSKLGATG
jgi:oxygen-independent coproporphyrinogen-3 oxidase